MTSNMTLAENMMIIRALALDLPTIVGRVEDELVHAEVIGDSPETSQVNLALACAALLALSTAASAMTTAAVLARGQVQGMVGTSDRKAG